MNSIFVIALSAIFVALAVASPLELTEDQKALAKKNGEICSKEIGLTEEEIAKVKVRDFKNPTDNIKCFANCFYEKTGTLKDGVIQTEVVLKKLGAVIGEEKTRAALDKCGAIKGENNCETGIKLHECFEEFTVEIKA
ncbi:hypothetical protein ACLKA7_013977 [Drosophila subpalustris]